MALLDPPQILPNAAHLIFRYLQQRDAPTKLSDLRDVLVPFGKSENDYRVLSVTAHACVDLGLLNESKSGYSVNDALPTSQRSGSFRELLRHVVLDPERNRDLWKEGQSGPSQVGARDFIRAISWFLSLDIYSLSGRYAPGAKDPSGIFETSVRDFGQWNPIVNVERWQPFVRWSTYLGLAWALPQKQAIALYPDPTGAVADQFGKGGISGVLSVGEFVAALAERVPVLDHGSFREETMARTNKKAVPEELSASLSHALLRLELAGRLKLSSVADAPKWLLRRGTQETLVYSHVHVIEADS